MENLLECDVFKYLARIFQIHNFFLKINGSPWYEPSLIVELPNTINILHN